jgi:hypothetical protein
MAQWLRILLYDIAVEGVNDEPSQPDRARSGRAHCHCGDGSLRCPTRASSFGQCADGTTRAEIRRTDAATRACRRLTHATATARWPA